MAIIPEFFRDAVVAFGVDNPKGERNWVGTGFLVGMKRKEDPNRSDVFIITNKHVVKEKKLLFVRFNYADTVGAEDLSMPLIDEVGNKVFTEHPVDEVDVVAIRINTQIIEQHKLRSKWIDIDDHALTLEKMKETGVEEGSLVYALGFPLNLQKDVPIKAPICRLGCISRVADAFIDPKSATDFLVDAQTFPGNSGGPIISRPEVFGITGTPYNSNACLIGVLSAYIPYFEPLISIQTGRQRMLQEENSGLTIVHPVDRIYEVIQLEKWRVQKRNEAR